MKFKSLFYYSWLIPFIGFLIGYAVSYYVMQQKTQTVPNILGKNLQEAMNLLAQKSLSIRLTREKVDDVVPEGVVVQQVPSPFQKVRLNQTVFVTVSKKPDAPLMPGLLGKSLDDVLSNASKQAINLKTVVVAHHYPKGKCVAQYPLESKPVDDFKGIAYFSGGTKELCVMPDFKGYALHDVQQYLNAMKIGVEVFGACPPNNLITDQKPMAGSLVDLTKELSVQLQV